MERLTEKEVYDGKVCFKKCANTECPDKCAYCDIPKEAMVKLKEYEDLEEQGRLLKLPCAVGDVVYEIDPIEESIEKKKVDSIELHEYGVSIFAKDISDSFDTYDTSDFGGVVFLSKEEAEAALKEM